MSRRALPLVIIASTVITIACGKAEVAGLGTPKNVTDDAGGTTAFDAGGSVDPDGGEIFDTGNFPPPFDAGFPDGGTPLDPDGSTDVPDGGDVPPHDSGVDAGPPVDGGVLIDAGTPDAGTPDSGVTPDAGTPDAGTPDAGMPECMNNADCRGIGPEDYCEPMSMTCVECLVDSHCPFNGTCDTTHGFVCRPTCFNGFCPPGQQCDANQNVCVDCLTDMDCNNGERCHPIQRECVECLSNTDCALAPGQPICDSDNDCVGCASDTDCPMGEQCYDYQGGFCAPAQGRSICTPCLGDAECGGAADLCIGYNGAGGLFDRSCSPGCMVEADCPRGWDCVNVRQGSAQTCRPRYSMQTPTCTAERRLGAACRGSTQPTDSGCGLLGVQDARCEAVSASGATQCVIWCQSNDECPVGTSCLSSGNRSVCR